MLVRHSIQWAQKLVLIFLLIYGSLAVCQTPLNGELDQDTHLVYSESPYLISENLIIPQNIHLTIEPGVTILLESMKKIYCEGIIEAYGTADSVITFSSTTQNGSDVLWDGLFFQKSKVYYTHHYEYIKGNLLRNCIVEKSLHGITIQNDASIMVDSSVIKANEIYAMYIENCDSSLVINSEISNNHFFGVRIISIDSVYRNQFVNTRFQNNVLSAIELEALKGSLKYFQKLLRC